MDIEETGESKGANLKKIAKDVLEVAGDAIGTLASPGTLWLMVLWNCSGGKGFSGFITNKTSSPILPPGGGDVELKVSSISEGGTVTVTINGLTNPEGTYYVPQGTRVTLRAQPLPWFDLIQWLINGVDRGKLLSFDYVVNVNTRIEANWRSTAP